MSLATLSYAQKTVVTGAVYDDANKSVELPGVTVQNLNTKAISMTNNKGRFTIAAKVGDLLSFSYVGFQTDTLFLTNLLTKIVYLPHANFVLGQVDIESTRINKEVSQAKDELAETYTRFGTGGNLARKRNNDKVGGLQLNLGYGKYRRNQLKEAELRKREQLYEEIDRNFNENAIQKLIDLKGKELKAYMVNYRPTADQVQEQEPFNYTLYIVRTYTEWTKMSPEQKKALELPDLRLQNKPNQ